MFCYYNGPLKSNSLPKQVSAAIFILREMLWLSASNCNCKLVTKWKGGSLAPRYAHPLLPASFAWDCRGTKMCVPERKRPGQPCGWNLLWGSVWRWMALMIMKREEHTRIVFIYLLLFQALGSLVSWEAWKSHWLSQFPLLAMWKKVGLLLYLCVWFWRGWFCFHLSHPLLVQLLVPALMKQSLVLLRERSSEHVTRLFPETSVWSSEMGSGCNQKMSKCLLHRSKEESSAIKIALSSKGKAVWQPLMNKEVRTNPRFAKYYLFPPFFFFFFSTPTELLPGFLKIIVRLAWRYTFKISIFLLKHIWL